MRDEVKQFLDNLITEYLKLNLDVESFVLFGSQARNTATLSSDIDIAVLVHNDLSARDRGIIISLPDEISSNFNVNFFFTTREFVDLADNELDTNYNIKKEGVTLWEK